MFNFLEPNARHALYAMLIICGTLIGLGVPALGFNPNVTGLIVMISLFAGVVLSIFVAILINDRIKRWRMSPGLERELRHQQRIAQRVSRRVELESVKAERPAV